MSVTPQEVSNFTQHVSDTLFGSSKCNKIQRIQFTCKRKQIIEKLNIFLAQNKYHLSTVFSLIIEREGLFVYKCKRSDPPVKCAVSEDICHTYDEVHLMSQTSHSVIKIRTDITDVICKLHTFVHWQSFVICMLYTSEKIDHLKVYEQFCVVLNFINALCTRK